VEFIKKGDFDNPKVCALALMKGSLEDAQKLFPLAPPIGAGEDGYDEDTEEEEELDKQPEPVYRPPPPPPGTDSRKLKDKLLSQKRKSDPAQESSGELPLIPIILVVVLILAAHQGYRMFVVPPAKSD
jgi:hypothetical protein